VATQGLVYAALVGVDAACQNELGNLGFLLAEQKMETFSWHCYFDEYSKRIPIISSFSKCRIKSVSNQ